MNGRPTILTIQGVFYLITGLWPVVHMRSFEAISGPKKDKWLVQSLGLMITVSGLFFLKFRNNESALYLAVADAIVLAAVDVFFVWKRIIWKVYLADAAIEVAFMIALWWEQK